MWWKLVQWSCCFLGDNWGVLMFLFFIEKDLACSLKEKKIFMSFLMTCSPQIWSLQLSYLNFNFTPQSGGVVLSKSTPGLPWAILHSLNSVDFSSLLFFVALCYLLIGLNQYLKIIPQVIVNIIPFEIPKILDILKFLKYLFDINN